MFKKIFIFLIISISLSINAPSVFAIKVIGIGNTCRPEQIGITEQCEDNSSCKADSKNPSTYSCQPDTSSGIGVGVECFPKDPDPARRTCIPGYSCQQDPNGSYSCHKDTVGTIFGKIQLPDVLKGFFAKDPTGAGAISTFLSNGVTLIYSIASIVLIFMLLWGAFDWMTSGGDKEKLSGAQRKIINAIIGIILFAVAFAVIQVLGTFTGFKFFEGQK